MATQPLPKRSWLRWAGDHQGRRCREKNTMEITRNPELNESWSLVVATVLLPRTVVFPTLRGGGGHAPATLAMVRWQNARESSPVVLVTVAVVRPRAAAFSRRLVTAAAAAAMVVGVVAALATLAHMVASARALAVAFVRRRAVRSRGSVAAATSVALADGFVTLAPVRP